MYTEVAIPSLVEAQFEEGGPWTLSRGTAAGVEHEKAALFQKYADTISEDPPSCLATLRRLLQVHSSSRQRATCYWLPSG